VASLVFLEVLRLSLVFLNGVVALKVDYGVFAEGGGDVEGNGNALELCINPGVSVEGSGIAE
jgi:hypothetical protein